MYVQISKKSFTGTYKIGLVLVLDVKSKGHTFKTQR